MLRLKALLSELRSSLWFMPALLVLGAGLLAVGLIEVDARVNRELLTNFPRLFGAGAEGSRAMLSAIAGSMITVAGVTFSITIVALSLASSQYTPRILRHFMRDRANQVVLGVFVGIFTYCLIVLRTIRGGDENLFVPSLAVIGGVVLALIGIGFLIFFIHHIAASIQAANIIAAAATETLKAVDKQFPDPLDAAAASAARAALAAQAEWATAQRSCVRAAQTGYIQNLDVAALVRLAGEYDTTIHMERGVGDFVVAGHPLVSVQLAPDAGAPFTKKLNGLYQISRYRTVEQDAAFGIRQIVDIALKALSPGINDPTTAVTCIDYLSAIMACLAQRRIESPLHRDRGVLRVVFKGSTFASLLAEAFDQIRQNAAGNAAIILRLLQALETIAEQTDAGPRRRDIAQHAELLAALAERTITSAPDRVPLSACHARLTHRLAAATRAAAPAGHEGA